MSDVFISYAHGDAEITGQLAQRITNAGLSVWHDHFIAAGDNFAETIAKAISDAKVVIVVLSTNSKRSKWLDEEHATALAHGKHVIPVLLDGEAKNNWVWPLIATRQAFNLQEESIEKLIELIEATQPASSPKDHRSQAELHQLTG